jgi:hypothetical protein
LLKVGKRPDGDTFVATQADGSPLQPRSITHEWVRVLAVKKLPRIVSMICDMHMLPTYSPPAFIPRLPASGSGTQRSASRSTCIRMSCRGMQDDAVAKLDAALKAAMVRK